jgi:hypothetical protein
VQIITSSRHVVVWLGIDRHLCDARALQQAAPAPSSRKRKPPVDAGVLQALVGQGDVLGFMLAFLPTADALQGLGLASRTWREAVDGAIPHVTIQRELPPGASLADRFPSLTSLHVERLSADDFPALLAGGLSRHLVRLRLSPGGDRAFRDAFMEVFFASEWPQLEHLSLTKSLRRFLDKAYAHPAALARLQSLGVVSRKNVSAVARAVRAGLLPGLRAVETGCGLGPNLGDWRTVLEHTGDTPVLRLKMLCIWRKMTPESDDSGSDTDRQAPLWWDDQEAEQVAQLLASGATARMR